MYQNHKPLRLVPGLLRRRPPEPYRKLIEYRRICGQTPCQFLMIERLHKHVGLQHRQSTPKRDGKCRNPLPISKKENEDSSGSLLEFLDKIFLSHFV